MIAAKNAVVWVNHETKQIIITPHGVIPKQPYWGDPIGAAYSQWNEMNNNQRINLMLETAIDLAMQGFPMVAVLKAFSEVKEFRALGRRSYPMCRALTTALVGKCLEPNTMSFEKLLAHYGEK
jgi:hypothetical protein